MKKYIVKITSTATAANVNFAGETVVSYYGKNDKMIAHKSSTGALANLDYPITPYMVHEYGYNRKCDAARNWTYRNPENTKWWTSTVEIVEIDENSIDNNSLEAERENTMNNSIINNSRTNNSPDAYYSSTDNNSTTEEDSTMIHPYKKHDAMLDRDLSAAERLEPARAALRFAVQLLQQFENETNRAYTGLTENQLQIICNAADQAWKAAENCAFLGSSGFNGHPLEMVTWEDQ